MLQIHLDGSFLALILSHFSHRSWLLLFENSTRDKIGVLGRIVATRLSIFLDPLNLTGQGNMCVHINLCT